MERFTGNSNIGSGLVKFGFAHVEVVTQATIVAGRESVLGVYLMIKR